MKTNIWCCILAILTVAGLAVNRRIDDFQTELDQLNFGAKYGLSKDETISSDNLNRIIAGAESGNRDNLYFLGLLKLYGNSVNKNPAAAMEHILSAAQLGLPEAMTAYGVMHYIGINVEKDHAVAFDWLRKATALHDANAHWFLGKMYMETGSGDIEAITHFSMAAEKGIPQALHYLGLMNEYGRGLPQNLLIASEYYRRAVELGYVESMYNLALMFCEGRGVEQNFNAAIPLFEAGVKANHAPSMYMMGVMRLQGYGRTPLKPDYEQALSWFEVVSSMDDPRVSLAALNAFTELNAYLNEAHQTNDAVIDDFYKRIQRD